MADDQVRPPQVLGQRVLEAEGFHRHGRAAARRRLQLAPPDLQHQLLVAAVLQHLRRREGERDGSGSAWGVCADPGAPGPAPSYSDPGTAAAPPILSLPPSSSAATSFHHSPAPLHNRSRSPPSFPVPQTPPASHWRDGEGGTAPSAQAPGCGPEGRPERVGPGWLLAEPDSPPPYLQGRRGADGGDQVVEAGGTHSDEHGLHGRRPAARS